MHFVEMRKANRLIGFFIVVTATTLLGSSSSGSTQPLVFNGISIFSVCKDPASREPHVFESMLRWFLENNNRTGAPVGVYLQVDQTNTARMTEFGRIKYYTKIGFRLAPGQLVGCLRVSHPIEIVLHEEINTVRVSIPPLPPAPATQGDYYIGAIRGIPGRPLVMQATSASIEAGRKPLAHETPAVYPSIVRMRTNLFQPVPIPNVTYYGLNHMRILADFSNPSMTRTFKVPDNVTLILASMPGTILTTNRQLTEKLVERIIADGNGYTTFAQKFPGLKHVPIPRFIGGEYQALPPIDKQKAMVTTLETLEQRTAITLCIPDVARGGYLQSKLDFQVYSPGTYCMDSLIKYDTTEFGDPESEASTVDTVNGAGTYVRQSGGSSASSAAGSGGTTSWTRVREVNEMVSQMTTLQAYLLKLAGLHKGEPIRVFAFGCSLFNSADDYRFLYDMMTYRSVNKHVVFTHAQGTRDDIERVGVFLTTSATGIEGEQRACPSPLVAAADVMTPLTEFPPDTDLFGPNAKFADGPIEIADRFKADVPFVDEYPVLETAVFENESLPAIPVGDQDFADTGAPLVLPSVDESEEPLLSPEEALKSKAKAPPPVQTLSLDGSVGTPDEWTEEGSSERDPKRPKMMPKEGLQSTPPPKSKVPAGTPGQPTSGRGRRLPFAPTRKARRSSSSATKRYTRRRRALRF